MDELLRKFSKSRAEKRGIHVASYRFMGSLGSEINSPIVDAGTSGRLASPLPGISGRRAAKSSSTTTYRAGLYYDPDIGWYSGLPPILEIYPRGGRLGYAKLLLHEMSSAGASLIVFLIKAYDRHLASDKGLEVGALYDLLVPAKGQVEKRVRKHFDEIGLKYLYLGPSNSMDISGPGNILFGYYVAKLWRERSYDFMTADDFAKTIGDLDQGLNPSSLLQFRDNPDDKLQLELGLWLFRQERRGRVIDPGVVVEGARYLGLHAFKRMDRRRLLIYEARRLNPISRIISPVPPSEEWFTPARPEH